MVYDDLPEELQPLFPSDRVLVPPSVRNLISDGWERLSDTQRHSMRRKLTKHKDLLKRTVEASRLATVAILTIEDVPTIEL